MDRLSRRSVLAGAAVALAGCTGGPGGSPPTSDSTTTTAADETTGATTTSESEDASGELPFADAALTVQHEFETLQSKVVSGGPPKDGIPSVDDPNYWDASTADEHLTDDDVVFGAVRNGEARAYPQFVLVWHEIANDTLGGDPVSVSYCPLTGTAMGFLRGGTTFGVSGRLVNNNLVMYDRATDSRWPQVLGTAISGTHQGRSLEEFRLVWTTWKRWREAHPETTVLSKDTGYARQYGRDPYGSYEPEPQGYYSQRSTLFERLVEDDRFHPKKVFIGARTPDGAVAFSKDAVRSKGIVTGELAGTPVLAVHDEGLDSAYVYRNPDGAEFAYDGGQVTAGDGTTHAPAALPLDRLYAFDAMWFAWSGFYPETEVFR